MRSSSTPSYSLRSPKQPGKWLHNLLPHGGLDNINTTHESTRLLLPTRREGPVLHPHVPELGVQREGPGRRRHGRDLPQRLGRRVSVLGVAALRGALRLRDGPPRIGTQAASTAAAAAAAVVL